MIQKPPAITGAAVSLLSPLLVAHVPVSLLPLQPRAAGGCAWCPCSALPQSPRAVPIPQGQDGPSSSVPAPSCRAQVPLCSQAAPHALMAASLPGYSHQPQPSLCAAVPAPRCLSLPLLRPCAWSMLKDLLPWDGMSVQCLLSPMQPTEKERRTSKMHFVVLHCCSVKWN